MSWSAQRRQRYSRAIKYQPIDSANPATNTRLESYEEHSQSDVDTLFGDGKAPSRRGNSDRPPVGSVRSLRPPTCFERTLAST
jgi:hypothetical protein